MGEEDEEDDEKWEEGAKELIDMQSADQDESQRHGARRLEQLLRYEN